MVSAMSGETNRLIALANSISEFPDPREMDVLLSTGEQVALRSIALHKLGCPGLLLYRGQVPHTDRQCSWQGAYSGDRWWLG